MYSIDAFFAGLNSVNGDLSTPENREEFYQTVKDETPEGFAEDLKDTLQQSILDGLFDM